MSPSRSGGWVRNGGACIRGRVAGDKPADDCAPDSDATTPREAATPNEAKHRLSEGAFAPLEAVERSRDDDAGERAGKGCVVLECRDELRRTPVEVLVATADDDSDRRAHPSKRGPASVGSIVGEDVFGLARPIQAEVAPGAPEAPGAWHERLRVSARDPLRERDPASKLAAGDLLHRCRDVGDGPEQDQRRDGATGGAGPKGGNLVAPGGWRGG